MSASKNGYSRLQIGLHWLVVVMVVAQIISGDAMAELIEAREEGGAIAAGASVGSSVHFWLGLGILAVMLLRLGVRLTTGVPAHAPGSPQWQNLAASVLHWAFYVVLLSVPISGLVAYYGLADVGEIHGLSKPLLIVLVAIHAGAALYNQFVRKDGTLTRMLRPQA